MKKLLPLMLLFLFSGIILQAQTEPCGEAGDEPPGCLMCGPIYIGSTAPYTPGTPGPSFPCGSIENNQWIAVIAGSTSISATILASNCQNGQGVQLLIYDTNLNPVSNCFSSGGNNVPGNVSATGLTPGEVYWIMIDGFAGDICDITLTVTGGQNVGPPDPPGPIMMNPNIMPVCPGAIANFSLDPVFGASYYEWVVSGPATILGPDDGNEITVEFDGPGVVTICVTPNNACFPGVPTCTVVTVLPIPPTILPPQFICENDFPIVIDGNQFNQAGSYTITYQTALGCDSLVTYNLFNIIVPPTSVGPLTFCPEDFPVEVDGNIFTNPGPQSLTFSNAQGCDSMVTYILLAIPKPPFVIDTVLCAGECIDIGPFNTFCDPGDYQVLIEDGAANGCDSVVRLFLDYIDVQANIAIPQPLGCGQNPTSVLDGSGSSSGPNVSYQWTASNGGVLVGPTNGNMATAGSAGNYTLTVTMVTNGRTCTISETTTVVNDANVPPAPTFLAGPLMVCEGDTVTYTIANIPSATGYTWTVPPPATFSGSGTSIQVAWNGSGNTQVCVTADNDCGSSPQTCLNITVNQIPTADFTFDSPICVTDSSTITYTGNASANANYQWSFNGGTPSMVTGPGPHEIRWATTGTKNVSLVVEENGCVSEMNTQQVIVQGPLPAPVINCSPTINSVTFNWNAVPGADSYDVIINGGAPVNQTNTSFSVTGLAPNDIVTITVIAIGTTACGPSMSSSDCQAQNCPQITLDIDPVMDICRDANTTPINLGYQITGDDGSGTFTWGGPGVDANGVFDPNAANLGINTITLNYQEGNCSYNASLNIVVNEAPTNDFTVESPICETNVSNIVYTGNASSNATFTWDFDGGTNTTSASNEGPYEIMWSSTGTKNISLVVEENGCALPANQQTVQVDVQLTPPVITCQSTTNTVDLTWTTDPNATNVTVNVLSGSTGTQNGNSYNVSGLVPGDSTVLEVVTSANSVCGPVTDTLTCIAASCPPVMLNIEPIGPFCDDGNGTPVPLNAVVSGGTGLGTFTWTGPGVNASNEFDPTAPAVIAGSVNRIRVTYVEDNCTFNASFDVVVNPQPSSTFQVTGPICITDVSTLEYLGTPDPNATYTWNLDGGTPSSISGPGPHDISWGTSGSKSISLIVDANNCPSDETVIPVRVDTLLAPPVISCNSTTSTVDFTWNNVPGANNYTVNLLNGAAGTYNGGFGYNVNGITVGDSTTIEVIANGPTVCGPSSSTITCYAAPCPPIELTLDPIPDICLYPNTLATNLNDFLTITGSVTGNPSVTWDGGGYVTLGGSFFPLQASTGTHPVRAVVEESGCTFEITGEIVVNAIPLADMIVEPVICIDDTSSVYFNGLAGTNATFVWDFGNGFDTWLQGGDAGPFALQWNDPGLDSISLYIIDNGCISDTIKRNIEIVDYLTPPVINCEGGATDVTFSWDTIPGATDYTVTVDNSPTGANFVPGTNSYTINSILPLDSVTITLTVGDSTSPCGPVTTTQTCIADDCPPVLLAFNPEPPICLDANAQNADVSDNVVITGNLSTSGTTAWTGPGTSPDGTFNPFDAGIGVHTLTVTYEEFNCTYNGTIDITVNDLPIADAGQDQTLTCNTTSVDLGGTGNNQNPSTVSYSWSGNVSQPGTVFTSATENGIYTLTATDQATGCVNTDEVEVIIDNEPPDLDAAVENISCFGRNDGTININGVSGGTPPYMYSYNGGTFSSQQFFNNLGPGTHEIAVEDSNGCMDTVTFTINEPDELNVEIVIVTGENPVPLGDSIQISAVTNFAPELLTNVSWTPIDQFPLCNEVNLTNCLTAWVTPTGQTVYTVRIEAGPCAAEDNFQLNVKKIRPVYIPSGFSPNLQDGLNDGFQIFADPEVATKVKSFLIFDRWGEVVFEAYDFEPSLIETTDNAWNGEFRGNKLNSGVFVYFAEIEFFDGITEIFKGDVTIR